MAKRNGSRNSRRNGYDKRSNSSTNRIAESRDNKQMSSTTKEEENQGVDSIKKYVDNTISWFTNNPLLLEPVSKVAFPYKPGMDVPSIAKDTNHNVNFGAIQVMNYSLSTGFSDSATSPVSLAAKEIYGKVRAAFSSTIADPTDFVIYLMAWDSVFNQIEEMKRVISVLNGFNGSNYMLPDGVLKAMGIDGDVYRQNKPQFTAYINTLIAMTRKVFVPDILPIIQRHMWIGRSIYLDSVTMQSQLMIFNNEYHYKFTLNAEDHYGELTPVKADKSTPETWFKHVQGMIEALFAESDTYTISGYLQRAYDNARPIFMESITGFEMLNPEYNSDINAQIYNSAPIPGNLDSTSLIISQDPLSNTIIHKPKCTAKAYTFKNAEASFSVSEAIDLTRSYLNLSNNSPTPLDVVNATRLHAVLTPISGDDYYIQAGSEIITTIVMFKASGSLDTKGNIVYNTYTFRVFNAGGDTQTADIDPTYFLNSITMNSYLGYLPLRYFFNYDSSASPKTADFVVVGNIGNLTIVDNSLMAELHRVCTLSLFNAFAL